MTKERSCNFCPNKITRDGLINQPSLMLSDPSDIKNIYCVCNFCLNRLFTLYKIKEQPLLEERMRELNQSLLLEKLESIKRTKSRPDIPSTGVIVKSGFGG